MSAIRTGRTTTRGLATLLTVLLLLATLASAALAHGDHEEEGRTNHRGQALGRMAPGVGADLARARAATARYHDVEVAKADGYVELSPCVESPAGAMGHHYGNLSLIGGLEATAPQALLYLPGRDGGLRLVGVEYLHPSPDATLFGQPFTFNPPTGLYALHVWLWQGNPAGMFADYNVNLSCPPAGPEAAA